MPPALAHSARAFSRACANGAQAPAFTPQAGRGVMQARDLCSETVLLLDERPLEYVLPQRPDARRCSETTAIEQRAEVHEHLRAPTDHRAVMCRIEWLDAELFHH